MAHACFSLLTMTTVLTVSGATRRWREGGNLHCPLLKIEKKCPDFAKKSALILEKSVLFVCIYGSNSHLKCSFKIILEKKTPKYFPAGSFFCRSPIKHISKCPYFNKPPLPRKISSYVPESQVGLCVIFHKACGTTFHLINSG